MRMCVLPPLFALLLDGRIVCIATHYGDAAHCSLIRAIIGTVVIAVSSICNSFHVLSRCSNGNSCEHRGWTTFRRGLDSGVCGLGACRHCIATSSCCRLPPRRSAEGHRAAKGAAAMLRGATPLHTAPRSRRVASRHATMNVKVTSASRTLTV